MALNNAPFFVTVDDFHDYFCILKHLGFQNLSDFENDCGKKGIFPGLSLKLEPNSPNPDNSIFYISFLKLNPNIRTSFLIHLGFSSENNLIQFCGKNNLFPGFKIYKQFYPSTPLPQLSQILTPNAPNKEVGVKVNNGYLVKYGKGYMWIPPGDYSEMDEIFGNLMKEIFGDEMKNVHYHYSGNFILRTSAYKSVEERDDLLMLRPLCLKDINYLEDGVVKFSFTCEKKEDKIIYENILKSLDCLELTVDKKINFFNQIDGIPCEVAKNLYS